ncbi:hypothetical protein EVAR_57689_1 [Eumeta japonica]|uniref:Uncharacterized protein n=1 Tax=Eumeta variegata TaxID=151549 RepID=A0A4C1YA11_EUMVA|nr:hypothetical protein EVAR_57689_1 [Eumeta japonica]
MQRCSVRLRRCDFIGRRGSAGDERSVRAAPCEPGASAVPYVADRVREFFDIRVYLQEHNELSVMKIECEDEDSVTTLDPRLGTKDAVNDIGILVKEEADFVVKMEVEDEVMIEEELDIGPTVLQPQPVQYPLPPLNHVSSQLQSQMYLIDQASASTPRSGTSSGDGAASTSLDTSTSIECSFKRMLVLDTWMSIKGSDSELQRQQRVFQALTQLLPDVENVITNNFEKRVANLCTRFAAIWKQVSRNHSRMVSKYGDWLNEIEVCVLPTCAAAGTHDTQRPAEEASTSTQHQHRKDFEDCSKRSKRRRLAELSKVDSSAINSLLDDSSRSNAASLNFNTDKVLSLINETKLTKHQYLVVKNFINAKSPNALPSYLKVLEAKKRCYPSQEFITESSAEVELQYCRPIRFQFAKESKELSVQEETYFKNKINSLQPSPFTHNGCEIKVLHSLQLTMVDDDKTLLAQKKQHVQQQFKQRLGLIVDKPRSGRSGTSNDGNTARRFFSNSSISAEITGLEKDLIDRCHNLLQCPSSGYKINNVAFKEYALDPALKLVAAYPGTTHPRLYIRSLIHGSEVIDHAIINRRAFGRGRRSLQ